MKPILFLLKPDFSDPKIGTEQQRYFCPHSAFIEGVLQYYPQLHELLTIRYVDFPRPRKEVIDLIGEALIKVVLRWWLKRIRDMKNCRVLTGTAHITFQTIRR